MITFSRTTLLFVDTQLISREQLQITTRTRGGCRHLEKWLILRCFHCKEVGAVQKTDAFLPIKGRLYYLKTSNIFVQRRSHSVVKNAKLKSLTQSQSLLLLRVLPRLRSSPSSISLPKLITTKHFSRHFCSIQLSTRRTSLSVLLLYVSCMTSNSTYVTNYSCT